MAYKSVIFMCTKIFLYLLRLIIAWSLSPSTLSSPQHGMFSLHVYTGICGFKSTWLSLPNFPFQCTFTILENNTSGIHISGLSDFQTSVHPFLACLLPSSVSAMSFFHTIPHLCTQNNRDVKSHHRHLLSPSSSLH